MDEHGILPDALDAACRKHSPKAVYLSRRSTIHHRYDATVGREQIADILRARRAAAGRRCLRHAGAKAVPLARSFPSAPISPRRFPVHRARAAGVVLLTPDQGCDLWQTLCVRPFLPAF
jgi:hypothetical protein